MAHVMSADVAVNLKFFINSDASASNGACKDLLKDTSVLQFNIMDYKSDIDNLKSLLHSINNRQIAEAVILTINKFSSKLVVTKEECTSTIKWSNTVARRRSIQRDFKKSVLIKFQLLSMSL